MLNGKSTSLNTDCSFLLGEKQRWWTLLNGRLSIVSVCKFVNQIKSNVFIKHIHNKVVVGGGSYVVAYLCFCFCYNAHRFYFF